MKYPGTPILRRRAFTEAFCVLYAYYLLLTLFIILPPIGFAAAGMRVSLRPGTAITLVGVVIAESLALWMVIKYFQRHQVALLETGWLRPTSRRIVVLAFIVAIAYTSFTAQLPEVADNFYEISLLKLWGVIAGVFGAFVEEVIFRGYVLTRLQQAGLGNAAQIVLSALAFGFLHMGFGWWGVICTTVLGLALGWLYVYGKRSLTGPLICHCLINALIEPWLLLGLLKFYAERYAG